MFLKGSHLPDLDHSSQQFGLEHFACIFHFSSSSPPSNSIKMKTCIWFISSVNIHLENRDNQVGFPNFVSRCQLLITVFARLRIQLMHEHMVIAGSSLI